MSNLDRPHQGGPAEQRIEQLLDQNSFSQMEAFVRNADVIAGYGTVNGRLVFVYSQYGPVTLEHAKKIGNLYRSALKMGSPVIGILDSKGLSMQDGLQGLEAYGLIFSAQSAATGIIPQLCLVLGDCMGASAFIPQLSDFVVMPEKTARLFLQSPNTFTDGSKINFSDHLGGAYHARQTGAADIVCESESLCIETIKELLSYLPSNNLEDAPVSSSGDDLNRTDDLLNDWLASDKAPAAAKLAAIICDNGQYVEPGAEYGKSIATLFGRFNGYTAGLIANQGALDNAGAKKARRFAAFCNAFHLPLINLVNVKGYDISSADNGELMESAAALMRTYTAASIPKINVIIGEAIGSPYLVMNSKHLGADIVYAWPQAAVSLMESAAAEKILGIVQETEPREAAEQGYVDEVIEPDATRKRIIAALEMLATKRTKIVTGSPIL